MLAHRLADVLVGDSLGDLRRGGTRFDDADTNALPTDLLAQVLGQRVTPYLLTE